MNILIIMDPGIPVPPVRYGGIERIVYLLANAYHAQGHSVTLFAGPESYCAGSTIPFGVNKLNRSKWAIWKEVLQVWCRLFIRNVPLHQPYKTSEYDVIHNFGRLLYLLPVLRSRPVKIMSYQRKITLRNIRLMNMLTPKNLLFTACSSKCREFSTGTNRGVSRFRKHSSFNNWHTIYNAVDFSKYQPAYCLEEDAPLIFLGRLEQIKGVHLAIQVAKTTNRKLWIAGNIPANRDAIDYYEKEISMHLDGVQIIYLGELDDRQKNHYLARSAALLFPIAWDEPFGIVMIEAMACGTPVIAYNRGSVPEVVSPGETGFIVNDIAEMSNAVRNLRSINRLNCRYAAMSRFDISVIAGQYLALAKNNLHSNQHNFKPTTKQFYVS